MAYHSHYQRDASFCCLVSPLLENFEREHRCARRHWSFATTGIGRSMCDFNTASKRNKQLGDDCRRESNCDA